MASIRQLHLHNKLAELIDQYSQLLTQDYIKKYPLLDSDEIKRLDQENLVCSRELEKCFTPLASTTTETNQTIETMSEAEIKQILGF